MEILAIVLFALGILGMFVELLMPGFGVFGLFGLLFVFISWGITIFVFELGIIVVLIEIILLIIIVILFFKKLKNTDIFYKIVLADRVNFEDDIIKNDFVGKEGICRTDLKPFGRAEIDGKMIEVFSQEGYIKIGSLIEIVRVEENNLYVKKIISE